MLMIAAAAQLNPASECGVVNDRCGYENGEPLRQSVMGRGQPSVLYHPDDHAHECCDGLICDDNVCRRSNGVAPSAEDLVVIYDQWLPETRITLEKATELLSKWQGREERLFTSVRMRSQAQKLKSEL